MTKNKKKRTKFFVIDSWSWIEYFDGTKSGEKIKEYVEKEKNIILTSSVTIAEVVSKFLRKHMDSQLAIRGITTLSKTIPISQEIAIFGGELHAEIKANIKNFGLADALILATACTNSAKVLTGDPHFKKIKQAVFIG